MLPLRLQHFAIRPQRGQHRCGLLAGHASQRGLHLFEAPSAPVSRLPLRQLLQRVLRRGALGLHQRIVDGLDLAQAVDLKAATSRIGILAKARIWAA